jgi:hypothetical protein
MIRIDFPRAKEVARFYSAIKDVTESISQPKFSFT